MSQTTVLSERREKVRSNLRFLVGKILDNPNEIFDFIAASGCAYLGYLAAEGTKDPKIQVTSAFSGILGYKLAMSSTPTTSTIGLGILASLGIITTLDILADMVGQIQGDLLGKYAESEGIPEPVFKPEDVPSHKPARYCIACPEGDFEVCGLYLGLLLNDYKDHYISVHGA